MIDGTDTRPRIGLGQKTPPALLAAGFSERPLTISRSVIEKLASGAEGQRAGLSATEIAELPASMRDPLAIYDFERSGARDSASVLFMRGDELWLAGVARDPSAGSYVVNELLPAFAPDVSPARLAGLNRDMTGRIRYVDRGRVFALPARIRDQSPALTQAARNRAANVATPARMVNRSWPEVDPPVMSKSEQRGLVFYSELHKQVEAMPTQAAPASAWKSTIAALKGVKPQEIQWSGINDWLDMRGASKVTET